MNHRNVAVKLIAGKEYVLRNGRCVYVENNPHWQCAAKFPFFATQGSDFLVYFTPEGRANPAGGEHEYDIIRPVYETSSWVGKRVHFAQDGASGTGQVLYKLECTPDTYAVRADSPLFEGHGTCGLKWHVYPHNMRVADENTGTTGAPPIPILATPAPTSLVGMRVEVRLDCGTIGLGVIKYEDKDGTVAVEFDDGTECDVGLHNCSGIVPSGRGWWCSNDIITVRVEDEDQAEAWRSDAEALTEADVDEIWAAYRINPSISIDAWIASRRHLKAVAKYNRD